MEDFIFGFKKIVGFQKTLLKSTIQEVFGLIYTEDASVFTECILFHFS